ncbi:putative SET domain, tetratricopeptide-like helical domain superfamily [Septoria linicola]|nr:putative SET domain, tetratricopeptide-like helical domain superfamily [Septoria linicola]
MSRSIVEDAPFAQQDVPGKGKGLVACRDIAAGTLLIKEAPLFTTESLCNASTIEKDLAQIVKSLSKEGQRAFLSLHNNFKGEPNPFSNIVRSNGYPLGASSDIGGIFPLVSRINHSCLPNAQHAWSEKLKSMLVHAVRDIKNGEELTLSYLNAGPSTTRQHILKENFRFQCTCELCSLPSKELKASDERLLQAQKLDESIGDPKTVRNSPERALADCRTLRDIYEVEQLADLRLPRLYYDAFQICAMHGDRARASAFARRARQARTICEGKDSEEVANLTLLEKEPDTYENFGVTTKWKTKIGDMPEEEGKEQEFERWLWKLNV